MLKGLPLINILNILKMDSYQTYRHSTDNVRIRIVRLLWSYRAYRQKKMYSSFLQLCVAGT